MCLVYHCPWQIVHLELVKATTSYLSSKGCFVLSEFIWEWVKVLDLFSPVKKAVVLQRRHKRVVKEKLKYV